MVDPNRADDLSGLGHLAAVGLVFLTLVAVTRELRRRNFWTGLRSEPDLLSLLHLVALGTVADVVPLHGLNRAFVAKGLIALKRREHPGPTALMDVARLSGPPEPWHLGFLLGPRINAGGRIGRADLGVRLLLEEDPIEAARIAAELDRLNFERQQIERATLAQAEAEALAALGLEEKGAVIVTAAEGWHPGVVGLVAARLKERFGRPAFAIALEPGGTGTGSGRSIPGVDLGRSVRRAVQEGLLLKGGGHAMAAGVTLKKDLLGSFRAFIENALAGPVESARRDSALLFDGAVAAGAFNFSLADLLARAGPFGAAIRNPCWRFRHTRSPTSNRPATATFGPAFVPVTEKLSTPLPFAQWVSRSVRSCWIIAAALCTRQVTSPLTGGRVRSVSSCGLWTWPRSEPRRNGHLQRDDILLCRGRFVRLVRVGVRVYRNEPTHGASMPLNFHSAAAVERVRQGEAAANTDRQEQFVTVAAASLAVLIVAVIAVLMGMV